MACNGTRSQSEPTIQDLLSVLKIAQSFADYPKNFIPPALSDPCYVAPFNGQAILGTAFAFAIITLIVVVLRLYVRVRYRRASWGYDDTLIIPATVCNSSLAKLISVIHSSAMCC
jgi:hypothetical protein